MNWFMPIGLAIGAFIGFYFLSSQSLSLSLFYALVSFITGLIISIIMRDSKGKTKEGT